MGTFTMPSLGADMEAGTLVEWLKHPGDTVARGDIIAVVETQKGAIEVEVFDSGILGPHLVAPGTKVPVGTPLAEITAGPAVPPSPEPPSPRPTPAARSPQPSPHSSPQSSLRASPAARRLAREQGIALEGLHGSGPGGAISVRDLPAPSAEAPKRGLDLAAMRQAIAAAMARSKREIPHYYLSHTIDIGPAQDWLARTNADRPPERRLLMAALYIKALARTLETYGEFNGVFEDGAFRPMDELHIGMAITLRGGGLVAPALLDVGSRDLEDLTAGLRDLTARARRGSLRSSELTAPTITLSSLGDRGVDSLWGVIHPPQVALVGIGTAHEAPAAWDGTLAVRPLLSLTLAGDHRVSDGHRGALFLRALGALLQTPEALT